MHYLHPTKHQLSKTKVKRKNYSNLSFKSPISGYYDQDISSIDLSDHNQPFTPRHSNTKIKNSQYSNTTQSQTGFKMNIKITDEEQLQIIRQKQIQKGHIPTTNLNTSHNQLISQRGQIPLQPIIKTNQIHNSNINFKKKISNYKLNQNFVFNEEQKMRATSEKCDKFIRNLHHSYDKLEKYQNIVKNITYNPKADQKKSNPELIQISAQKNKKKVILRRIPYGDICPSNYRNKIKLSNQSPKNQKKNYKSLSHSLTKIKQPEKSDIKLLINKIQATKIHESSLTMIKSPTCLINCKKYRQYVQINLKQKFKQILKQNPYVSQQLSKHQIDSIFSYIKIKGIQQSLWSKLMINKLESR